VIDRDVPLCRSEDLVSAPLGREIAMLDIESGSYYILDDVAAFVWERLAAPATLAELCGALQTRFDVTPAQCEADLRPFLQALHEKGLVRIVA
jgi:predicted phage gp36 major capsid-like protein